PDIDQFFNMDPSNYIFAVRMRAPQSPFPCREILTFFRESLSPENNCVILETQADTAIFLLNYSGTEQHKDEVLHLLLTDLYWEKGYWSAISNSSSSPMDIPSLYEHSILTSKFWEHTPVVSYYEVAAETNTDSTLTYPYDILNKLSASLHENNCKDASVHVKELFRIIDVSTASGDNLPDFFVRSILFDLLTIIANAMNDMNIRFKAFSDLYFETLYYCRSFPYEQNRETIQKNIDQLLSFFEEQLDNKITNSYQLGQMMEEYYSQPDFSITVLADKFQVSVAYMSYLIKKETNQTFSDYLWELRLTKAKELLLTTSQSVDEISLAVGYANTSSFRRKFKQVTGLTPSQFRNGESCAATEK
ncbi:MAG: helix-turn-helix transcriptional regulator, partial [Roseburia sp.]|nr:helix-turn-helix transcriptional regulator [Roseburia sp.]